MCLIKQLTLYNFIKMRVSFKTILVLSAVILLSVVVWKSTTLPSIDQNAGGIPLGNQQRLLPVSYQTSVVRSSTVTKACKGGYTRSSFFTDGEVESSVSYRASVNSALGIDGNALIKKVTNSDLSGAISMVSGSMTNLGIFVGSFAVGLVIFYFIWPFLCCCCCCPSCCPSKCCQKAQDEQYSKCQLNWPTITLILALLLTICASVYGFVNASNVGPVFGKMSCSAAIFTDDLLNGNVTDNGTSYFVGLNNFKNQMDDLNNNLTDIQNALNNIKGGGTGQMDYAIAACGNAKTLVLQIPTSPSGAPMTLSFQAPINNAAGTTALPSTFINTLGSYTTANSLTYTLYKIVEGIQTFLTDTKNSANTFYTGTGGISGEVANIKTTIGGLITNVNSMDTSLGNYLDFVNMPSDYGTMGMQIFYGIMIAFSFFALIGALLTACCNKYGCRHLMYFSCIFLFLIGLIGFLVSVLFSILVPILTWTCSYMDIAMADQTGFQANMGSFLDTSTLTKISVCMPFGSGDIISQVGGTATAKNALNNLTLAINKMGNYNASGYITNLTNSVNKIYDTIDKVANGKIPDLDNTNFNILDRVANPANFPLCTDPQFPLDSWIPAIGQDINYSTINCRATSGLTGVAVTTCTANFPISGTCKGCMDSTNLFNAYSGGIGAKMLSRYNSVAGCAGFSTEMDNIWNNYYSPKISTMGAGTAVSGIGVLGRALDAKNLIINNANSGGVFFGINAVNTLFATARTALNTASAALTDPTYGMLAGLNCKLFGQDFVRLQKVTCGSLYSSVYLIRLTLGIACYGILFSMCCIVCTGVRHFKHSEREKKVTDAFFKNSFEEGSKRVLNTRQ